MSKVLSTLSVSIKDQQKCEQYFKPKRKFFTEFIFYSWKANRSYRKCTVEYMNTVSLC